MAQEALLSQMEIPAENIHRMRGEGQPQMAAAEYEEELQKFFSLNSGALPRFDLILLGIGEDGHTASLFPGSEALNETKHLVVAPFVAKLKSHRLSLSLAVLNNAAEVWFLVTGGSKADAVKRSLQRFFGSSCGKSSSGQRKSYLVHHSRCGTGDHSARQVAKSRSRF